MRRSAVTVGCDVQLELRNDEMATQSVDKVEALKRLRLFNEKSQELRSYSFIEKATHKDAGITINFDSETKTVEGKRVGADNEARSAMCLVLRFFLQPRDHIELHQMAELYTALPIKNEDKQLVADNLKTVDEFLDRASEPSCSLNGAPSLTYRTIIETFMYGDQAHANKDKRATFEAWKEFGPTFLFLENCFEYAVSQVIRYIMWLASMNVISIKALEQAISGSQTS